MSEKEISDPAKTYTLVEVDLGEVLRFAVERIKKLSYVRVPEYDLPPDSFIEEAVKEIILETVAATRKAAALADCPQ